LSPRSSGTNTPLKTYEQLACGVPLVATSIYSHTQVLDESVAVLVPPTAQGLSSGIERLLDDSALGDTLVANAQAHYAKHYNRDAYTRKLRRLLELVN
jgi:glycosyltransferase involved in cell wall biosynthesis